MDQLQHRQEAMLNTNLRTVQCTCSLGEDVIQCTRQSFIDSVFILMRPSKTPERKFAEGFVNKLDHNNHVRDVKYM